MSLTTIYFAERGGGKTTHMLEWLAIDPQNRVLVVANSVLARMHRVRAMELFPQAGIKATNFVVPGPNALRGRRHVQIGIDQADDVLAVMLGADIEHVTWTSR